MTHFQKYSADARYIFSVSNFSCITSLIDTLDKNQLSLRKHGVWKQKTWMEALAPVITRYLLGLFVLCVMTIATSALTSNCELSCL